MSNTSISIYNGMEFTNRKGFRWRVVDCSKARKVVVESLEWMPYTREAGKESILKGAVMYPYGRMIDGCYTGEGKWLCSVSNPHYRLWNGIRARTLSSKFKQDHPTYQNASLHPDWYNLQNFCDWAERTKPKTEGIKWEIDKDLLGNGSGLYSEETCCWLPKEVNLFLSRMHDCCVLEKQNKGGVVYTLFVRDGADHTESASGRINPYVGTYPTFEQAIQARNIEKRNRLEQLIEKYVKVLPPVVIEALWLTEPDYKS